MNGVVRGFCCCSSSIERLSAGIAVGNLVGRNLSSMGGEIMIFIETIRRVSKGDDLPSCCMMIVCVKVLAKRVDDFTEYSRDFFSLSYRVMDGSITV